MVAGSSRSGKTTVVRALAESLDAPHLGMDVIFHGQGWADIAHEKFLPTLRLHSPRQVEQFIASLPPGEREATSH